MCSAEAVDNGHGPGCFEDLVEEGSVKILMGVTRICYIVSWSPDFLDFAADLEYSFVIDRPTGDGFIFSCFAPRCPAIALLKLNKVDIVRRGKRGKH